MFISGDFLINLIHSELTVRHKRSMLGFLWTMLNPVIMTAVYTVVFSTIFRFGTKRIEGFRKKGGRARGNLGGGRNPIPKPSIVAAMGS